MHSTNDEPKKLTEEMIKEAMEKTGFFNAPSQTISLHTGHGGVVEYVKAWITECNKHRDTPVEITPERIQSEINAMVAAGWIIPHGPPYEGLYQIK